MSIVYKKAIETSNGILLKTSEGVKHAEFKNYFYVDSGDLLTLDSQIEFLIDKYVDYKMPLGRYTKLVLKDNFMRRELIFVLERAGIKMYENDINTVKRYLIDKYEQFEFGNVKILWYDIETDDRGEFLKDKFGTVIAGTKQILSIASVDEQDNIFFIHNENPDDVSCKSEYLMLKQFFEHIKKYDLLTAWNGSMFDRPYIEQRLRALANKNFDVKSMLSTWKLMIHLDELIKYKNLDYNKHLSYSLNSISKDELSDTKIDFSEDVSAGQGRFYELFKTNLAKFKEYNIKDVTLMKRIDEKRGHFRIAKHLSSFTKTPIESFMYNSHILDFLLLRAHHAKHEICDSKPNNMELERLKQTFIGGGYTFCYATGFFKNIDIFDFKSHYPLVMITFNISDETFVKTIPVDLDEVKSFMTTSEFTVFKLIFDMTYNVITYNNAKIMSLAKSEKVDLVKLMLKFTRVYSGKHALEQAKQDNLILTPADLNHDTNGWHIHPHRLFKKQQGVLSALVKNAVLERDKIKYKLWSLKKQNPDIVNSEEYIRLDSEQHVLKTLANSAYGFSGLKNSRFFRFNVADTITTCARWITKKSILFAQDNGFLVIGGDTDSVFLQNTSFAGSTSDMDKRFYEYYKNSLFNNFNLQDFNKIEFKSPITNSIEKHHYFCVFEWEKSYESMIMIAKKRYYYLQNDIVATQGGAFKKSDTNPLAAKLQKQLVSDILHQTYDRDTWKQRLLEIKDKCFSQKLTKDELILTVTYSKHWSKYGGDMLDSKTGLPKISLSGVTRQKNIPAYIQLAKRLEQQGNELQVGDAIQYVIAKPALVGLKPASRRKLEREYFFEHYDANDLTGSMKFFDEHQIEYKKLYDTKQRAILFEDLKTEQYDENTYWRRITSPILEILNVYDEELANEL